MAYYFNIIENTLVDQLNSNFWDLFFDKVGLTVEHFDQVDVTDNDMLRHAAFNTENEQHTFKWLEYNDVLDVFKELKISGKVLYVDEDGIFYAIVFKDGIRKNTKVNVKISIDIID